jgi:hypothetical protein
MRLTSSGDGEETAPAPRGKTEPRGLEQVEARPGM